MSPTKHGFALASVSVALLAMSGCSSGDLASGSEIPQAAVESQIYFQLQEVAPPPPDDVSCPGDMPGDIGETMRCEITTEAVTYGVTVEVTSISGGVAQFDIQVDEQPGG